MHTLTVVKSHNQLSLQHVKYQVIKKIKNVDKDKKKTTTNCDIFHINNEKCVRLKYFTTEGISLHINTVSLQ